MTGPVLFVPHFCCSEEQYLTESLGVWALSIFPAPYKELLKVYMSLSTLSYKVLICPQKQALLGKGDFQKFLDVSWSYPSLHPTLCFWVSTVLTQPITRAAEVRWRVKQWTFPSSLCSTHSVLFGNVVLFSLEHTVFLRGFFTHWNLKLIVSHI